MNDTPITIAGNLVGDPELRFTPAGNAVANFRIASTPKRFNKQTGQFEDEESLFLTCTAWNHMAENLTQTFTKGMRVIVTGNLKQRSYQTKEGENRTAYEITASDVGPSLRYQTGAMTKNPQQQAPQQNQQGQQFQGHSWADTQNTDTPF